MGDEPLGSGTTELVSWLSSLGTYVQSCRNTYSVCKILFIKKEAN
jgi:hypothetical protein